MFGAGFSAEAGLPVITSFLGCMRDAFDWLGGRGREDELRAIERVLQFRHESAAAGYRINLDLDNIEHLFSLAAAKAGTASADDIRSAISATLDFATEIAGLRVSATCCTCSVQSRLLGGSPTSLLATPRRRRPE
jgi:hypothetical protein